MKKYKILNINDTIVNKYLFFKNLEINRKYSSSKKIIKKLDHYLWWFQKQNLRKSFLILKDNRPIFISTSDHFKYGSYKFIYSGLLSCLKETNLFDLLRAIKMQNIYLNKQKKRYCFISIDKKNNVLLYHWKYFGYKQLFKKDAFYKYIKKSLNIGNNFNIYFKKI
tara:strand:+ start:154 stop:651 length:498 start_codon:yes stop_codon:yes gene_type:complete